MECGFRGLYFDKIVYHMGNLTQKSAEKRLKGKKLANVNMWSSAIVHFFDFQSAAGTELKPHYGGLQYFWNFRMLLLCWFTKWPSGATRSTVTPIPLHFLSMFASQGEALYFAFDTASCQTLWWKGSWEKCLVFSNVLCIIKVFYHSVCRKWYVVVSVSHRDLGCCAVVGLGWINK